MNIKTYTRKDVLSEVVMDYEDEVPQNDSDSNDEWDWDGHSNLQELIVEADTSKPESILKGRRIVDMQHVINEMLELGKHGKVCTMGSFKLVKELRVGLFTKFQFHCDNCDKYKTVTSEPIEQRHELNDAFVWGAVSVGIGFSQAEELISIMNTPTMGHKKFRKHEMRLGKVRHFFSTKT